MTIEAVADLLPQLAQRHTRPDWDRLAMADMFRLPLAPRYGGLGLAPGIVVEHLLQLGRLGLDPSVFLAASAHLWAVQYPIEHFGSEMQRSSLLPALASGALVGAHAVTEPDAGSDVSGMRTSARPVANGYVINGRKTFVTNGPDADLVLLIARTGPNAALGLTAFLVDRATPGLELTKPTLVAGGLSVAPIGDVVFDDCHVGSDAVLGRPGQGLRIFLAAMQVERLFILVPALGAALARLEAGASTAGTARNGKTEALTDVLVATLTARRAAAEFTFGTSSYWRSSVVKLSASRALSVAARHTTGLDEPPDALMHAQAAAIYSGTTNVHRDVLARQLGLVDRGHR